MSSRVDQLYEALGKREKMNSLLMMLSSTLNVELVYIILKSITIFSESMVSDRDGHKLLNQTITESGDVTVTLHEITIQNAKAWREQKADDIICKAESRVS